MAEALAVFGYAETLVTVIELVTKAGSKIIQLKEQWKGASLTVSSLQSQLSGLSIALTGIQQWMNGSTDEPYHLLVMGLDQCIDCCTLLMEELNAALSSCLITPGDQITRSSKIQLLFKSNTIKDSQSMIDRQVATLNLLLTACNAHTMSEQRAILEKSSTQRDLKKVRDDCSSLVVHRDTDSTRSRFTWDSIRSSKRSLHFEFDAELFASTIYDKTIRRWAATAPHKTKSLNPTRIPQKELTESPGFVESDQLGDLDETYEYGEVIRLPRFLIADHRGNEIFHYREADLKAQDSYGWQPLHYACFVKSLKVVHWMVNRGADVAAKSSQGLVPLHIAAWRGPPEVVTLLLSKGAHIEAKDVNDWTALHFAAYSGALDNLNLLLRQEGVDIDDRDVDNRTPLHIACIQANIEIVQILLDKGSDIEARDNDFSLPLHYAILHSKAEIVQLLLDHDADIYARDKDGKTVLQAVKPKHFECIEMLILKAAGLERWDGTDEALSELPDDPITQDIVRLFKEGHREREARIIESLDD